MNYKEVLKILKDNGDFDYINDLSEKRAGLSIRF